MSVSEVPNTIEPTIVSEPVEPWPMLPTETEIYLLPDGQVVVADLPAELADLIAELGRVTEGTEMLPSSYLVTACDDKE